MFLDLCVGTRTYTHTQYINKWIKCSKNKWKQIPFWSTIKNSFQINTLNYQVWKAKTSVNYCMGTKTWVFCWFQEDTDTHSFITLALVLPWQSGVRAAGPSVWASNPKISNPKWLTLSKACQPALQVQGNTDAFSDLNSFTTWLPPGAASPPQKKRWRTPVRSVPNQWLYRRIGSQTKVLLN